MKRTATESKSSTVSCPTLNKPQPAGSKERPNAIAGSFKVLVYQMSGASEPVSK